MAWTPKECNRLYTVWDRVEERDVSFCELRPDARAICHAMRKAELKKSPLRFLRAWNRYVLRDTGWFRVEDSA